MNNNKEICILNDYTIYAETNYFIVVTYTGKINLYDVPDKNIGMLSYNGLPANTSYMYSIYYMNQLSFLEFHQTQHQQFHHSFCNYLEN